MFLGRISYTRRLEKYSLEYVHKFWFGVGPFELHQEMADFSTVVFARLWISQSQCTSVQIRWKR